MGKLGLVLSAGGSRGAYEAGVIHYIRNGLPKNIVHRNFEIQTGTSVGAINTAAMVAMAHDPKLQGEQLKKIWLNIKQEHIYRRDLSAATHFLGATIGGMMRNFFTINPFQITRRKGPHFESFLDTTPLKRLLTKIIPWKMIRPNILKGPVDALALNATNLGNGRSEIFIQKKRSVKYSGPYLTHEGNFNVDHILASAAIPMIFPSVKIGNNFYADGGLRLFTPMSPAIQLGADHLLVIGLRHPKPIKINSPGKRTGKNNKTAKIPTIANQLGRILNGFFQDRLQFDMEQLSRINTIITTAESVYGKDFLEKINSAMKKKKIKLDIAERGLRNISSLEIIPSESLTAIFLNWLEKSKNRKFKFSTLEKFLIRLLEIDPVSGSDLMSYLTFETEYLKLIFELGYRDAEKKRNELIEIMGS